MSTSLSYQTTSTVAEEVRDQICSYINSLASKYEWWCEPVCFFDDPNYPNFVKGNTKLFLLIDDPAIDSFMAHADATKITELLADASKTFGVGWNLSLEGSPVGTIANGTLDEEASASLNSLLEICGMMGVDPMTLDREDILKSHVDR